MCKRPTKEPGTGITGNRLIRLLNGNLADQYLAVVAYLVYSQILKDTACPDIARKLELHASKAFQHVKRIAAQIIDMGGVPCAMPMAAQSSNALSKQADIHPANGSSSRLA